jgi:hypothetical protein
MNYRISRYSLIFIWLWHGIVPKLIFQSESELELMRWSDFAAEHAVLITNLAGVAEIIFAAIMFICWRHKWPMFISIAMMVGMLVGTMMIKPTLATQAFNPVSLNIAVIGLSLINLFSKPAPKKS